jgi:uncharacterized membrane protein YgdD (TMEM256/DUF423 family)
MAAKEHEFYGWRGFVFEKSRDSARLQYMNQTMTMRIAAAAGLLAVVLGAFGAHGLKHLLAQNGTAAIWETAVLYHFIHAVMLFILAERNTFPSIAWWSFLAGILFFSGSLYLLAVTNARWLGAVTPVGGVSFIIGWGALLVSAKPQKN